MAPTSEHDFEMLPPEKQDLYRAVQRTHIHGSPDGPWIGWEILPAMGMKNGILCCRALICCTTGAMKTVKKSALH